MFVSCTKESEKALLFQHLRPSNDCIWCIWCFELFFSYYVDDTFLVSFPDPPINENPDWEGWGEFGGPWNEPGDPWPGSLMAPFDEQVSQFLSREAESGEACLSHSAVVVVSVEFLRALGSQS